MLQQADGNQLTTPLSNTFLAKSVGDVANMAAAQPSNQDSLGFGSFSVSELEECQQRDSSTDHRSAGVGCSKIGNVPAEKHNVRRGI